VESACVEGAASVRRHARRPFSAKLIMLAEGEAGEGISWWVCSGARRGQEDGVRALVGLRDIASAATRKTMHGGIGPRCFWGANARVL
jgi:hypothetical protein